MCTRLDIYRLLFVLFCCISTTKVFAQSQPAVITEADLHPFCTSKYVRENYGVTVERCLDVAMACAKETIDSEPNTSKMTDKIYTCVFNRLKLS